MVRTDYTENNGSKDVACCIQKFTMRLQVLYKIKIETEKSTYTDNVNASLQYQKS